MFTVDPQIDKLVLKWANDIHGNWGDVIQDLMEFKEQVKAEAVATYLNPEQEEPQVEIAA